MSPPYPFDYIQLSLRGNVKVCELMGWEHVYQDMIPKHYHEKNHPALGKIYVVAEWLQEILSASRASGKQHEPASYMVFLDTDAWVQDAARLQQLVKEMEETGKQGAYSRDPYVRINTYINSGSFILKIDEYALKMYQTLIAKVQADPSHLHEWPWDQYYISQYVWEHRADFLIFKPDILNTGYGKILRHNWHKTSRKIRDDLFFLCNFPIILDPSAKGVVEHELDDGDYPNLEETGYDYMDFD
jgi:hypothetical protein